ncbi:hypothetical protein ACHAWF_011659, partial [Thalassiosira exigua]
MPLVALSRSCPRVLPRISKQVLPPKQRISKGDRRGRDVARTEKTATSSVRAGGGPVSRPTRQILSHREALQGGQLRGAGKIDHAASDRAGGIAAPVGLGRGRDGGLVRRENVETEEGRGREEGYRPRDPVPRARRPRR